MSEPKNQKLQTIVISSTLAVLLCFAVLVVGLRYMGFIAYSVQSDSMKPVFQKGDAVVARLHPTAVRAGQIVVFPSATDARVLITHRIIEEPTASTLVTKGDNNVTPEPAMPRSAILARGIISFPKLGYILDYLKKPIGLAILIYTPAASIIYAELRRYIHIRRYGSLGRYLLHGY